MDLLDRKIMKELDLNCRQSHAKIARRVRSSKAVINYRIRKLEREGVIKKYIASINLGKLGYNTFKLYFKLFGLDEKIRKEFTDFICKIPNVIHCIRTEGAFDFSVVIATKNIIKLDQIISVIRNRFSAIIKDYRLSIIVSTRVFGRAKVLLGKVEPVPRVETFSGAICDFGIEEKDRKILRLLSEDASQSILDVAKKSALSVDVVKYRMKKMVSSGIINNFRILFDAGKLGYQHYVFLLNMRKATKKDEEKFATWCQYNKSVMYITKRVGFWDYETHVALKDVGEYNAFVSSLEKELGDILGDYETITHLEVLKLTYFPE